MRISIMINTLKEIPAHVKYQTPEELPSLRSTLERQNNVYEFESCHIFRMVC